MLNNMTKLEFTESYLGVELKLYQKLFINNILTEKRKYTRGSEHTNEQFISLMRSILKEGNIRK